MNEGRIIQKAIPVRWRIVRTAPERTNLAAEVIPELSQAASETLSDHCALEAMRSDGKADTGDRSIPV